MQMTLTYTVFLSILIPVPGALPTLKPAAEIFPFSSFFLQPITSVIASSTALSQWYVY